MRIEDVLSIQLSFLFISEIEIASDIYDFLCLWLLLLLIFFLLTLCFFVVVRFFFAFASFSFLISCIFLTLSFRLASKSRLHLLLLSAIHVQLKVGASLHSLCQLLLEHRSAATVSHALSNEALSLLLNVPVLLRLLLKLFLDE